METFNQLLTVNEWKELISSNNSISIDERFKIDSFTFRTLLTDLGNSFTNNELQEVYTLEINNIKRIINSAYIVFYDIQTKMRLLNSSEFLKNLEKEVRGLDTSSIEKSAMFNAIYIKYLLSNLNNNLKPVFEGKIPTKLFSMRQITAESWFEYYVTATLATLQQIIIKSDKDMAFTFLMANSAYYLNKSQTFRFGKRSTESINDSIARILRELIGNEYQKISDSLNNVPLYKDL